jgi:hypothetical protein
MITEGHHREAMSWIAAMLWIANKAIQIDAPDSDKPRFQAKLDRLLTEMGLSEQHDILGRYQQARAFFDRAVGVADSILSHNPAIIGAMAQHRP